ncbi:MAG: aspartate ammonia-lyase [Candidatus Thermoplasmatota archaeon]|nr:aspartate ammonia-lyase [Candidatus Thermoplasmatota archaeon]
MARKEHDVLGEVSIPDEAFYGVNTVRAIDNFRISGHTSDRDHIYSIVTIKKAAAIANNRLGKLTNEKSEAIVTACDRILGGYHIEDFRVDIFQAGAGTSFNMNANEVIANVALEVMGKKPGSYEFLHPNDHVNMSQSTNDVYPTMMRLTAMKKALRLIDEADLLHASLKRKAEEMKGVVKPGRTHLQDAAPVTLGIELAAYAYAVSRDLREIRSAIEYLRDLNIGGTAVGTGINTATGYQKEVVSILSDLTGISWIPSDNLPGIMQFQSDFSRVMSSVANLALDINKISNDIRLLYSGPGAGIHEIRIPAVQQGSSIMPGKINPSIAEAMNMICHSVLGCQQAVNYSVQAGQLELNVMMPGIDLELSRAIDIFTSGLRMFRTKLIDGLEADEESCRRHLGSSFGSAALLNPYLGYDTVARIVQESLHTGKSIKDLALSTGKITESQYEEAMKAGIPR